MDIDILFKETEFNVGKRIKKLRKKSKFTQIELGEKIGVSSQVISNWEREYSDPSPDDFTKLAEVFNVTTDYLLLGLKEDELKDIRFVERVNTPLIDKLINFSNKYGTDLLTQILDNEIELERLFNNKQLVLKYKEKRITNAEKLKLQSMVKLLLDK